MSKEVVGEKHTLNTKYWKVQYKEQQFANSEEIFRNIEIMQKEVLGKKKLIQ